MRALLVLAIVASATPATADPLTRDERAAIRAKSRAFLRAARRGDGEALRAHAGYQIEYRRTDFNETARCRKLRRAPVEEDHHGLLARCLGATLRYHPLGKLDRIRRTKDGRVVARWHLDHDCDGGDPAYATLELEEVEYEWYVTAISLIDTCTGDP